MRVLLTGASGFLGGHVLPLLREHDVLCLSRTPDRLRSDSGVDAITADLTSEGEWTQRVTRFRPQWCLHLAWQGLPDYSISHCRTNLDASLRLLGVLADCGLEKMIVSGTCWEYGRAAGAVVESHLPTDVGVFAATKHALHRVLESVARTTSRFQYRWARIFFVYGAGQRQTSLIPSVRAACASARVPELREPATVQDFVHVDDVAAALLALATSDSPSGAFNVGTGRPRSVAEVANHVAAYYGKPRPFERVEQGSGFWADTTKMQQATGWRARIGIEDGIRNTLLAMDTLIEPAGAGIA